VRKLYPGIIFEQVCRSHIVVEDAHHWSPEVETIEIVVYSIKTRDSHKPQLLHAH